MGNTSSNDGCSIVMLLLSGGGWVRGFTFAKTCASTGAALFSRGTPKLHISVVSFVNCPRFLLDRAPWNHSLDQDHLTSELCKCAFKMILRSTCTTFEFGKGNVQHPNISKQNVFLLIVLLDQNIKNTLFVCTGILRNRKTCNHVLFEQSMWLPKMN